jgi:CubicO group peptidase (beta-lactamase class C family)
MVILTSFPSDNLLVEIASLVESHCFFVLVQKYLDRFEAIYFFTLDHSPTQPILMDPKIPTPIPKNGDDPSPTLSAYSGQWNNAGERREIMMGSKVKKKTVIIAGLCISALSLLGVSLARTGDSLGVNKLDADELQIVDQIVSHYQPNYQYINIALVREEEVVFTKSYGQKRLDKTDVYASVSKPVTAMIFLQLLEAGKISSVQDEIAGYDEDYAEVLPKAYGDTPITFLHLLTHQSGVSHLSDMWNGETLNLAFQPGTDVMYSSNAYGILGDVMEEITGLSYSKMVETYIGNPVGASSFWTIPHFQAPAGQVRSTIQDMARFAIGVMDGTYVSEDTLQELVYKKYAQDESGDICLGWYCTNLGSDELTIYHAGSNGRPRAFLAIEPYQGFAVAITGLNHWENSEHDFGDLAIELMAALKDF